MARNRVVPGHFYGFMPSDGWLAQWIDADRQRARTL